MALVKITITNWEKFNPRSDRANYTWLRLQSNFFNDQKIFGLSHSQITLYLFMLCEASKSNRAAIEIKLSYISALLKYENSDLINDFHTLEDARLLVSDCHLKVSYIPTTNERTNDTNDTLADAATSHKMVSSRVKEIYCTAYKNKYGINPAWSVKENTLAKKLVTAIGHDEAIRITGLYLDYPDPWHIKNKHPFSLLFSQIDKIRVEINDPKRMFDEHAIKKQIDKISEVSYYDSERKRLDGLIEQERLHQIGVKNDKA